MLCVKNFFIYNKHDKRDLQQQNKLSCLQTIINLSIQIDTSRNFDDLK